MYICETLTDEVCEVGIDFKFAELQRAGSADVDVVAALLCLQSRALLVRVAETLVEHLFQLLSIEFLRLGVQLHDVVDQHAPLAANTASVTRLLSV